MIRILICDDDPIFAERLNKLLIPILEEMKQEYMLRIISSIGDITDELCSKSDVLFLDIDLKGKNYNGIDVARRVRKHREDSVIVFVTGFLEYAPEGYEVKAFRYILKQDIEVGKTGFIREAFEQFKRHGQTFKFSIGGEQIDLNLDDILYFEVSQHSVNAVMRKSSGKGENRVYRFNSSLTKIEEQLEPRGFLRTHKSYLVNMKYIRKMQCRQLSLLDGSLLPVGEKSYSQQKKKYLAWRGQY